MIILSAPIVWEHHELPYDFFRFTRYGMQYIFEKAGFEIVEIKANGGKWANAGANDAEYYFEQHATQKGNIQKIIQADASGLYETTDQYFLQPARETR